MFSAASPLPIPSIYCVQFSLRLLTPRTVFVQVIFITEYMSSGSLKQFLKRTKRNVKKLPLQAWKRWCSQILSALRYVSIFTPRPTPAPTLSITQISANQSCTNSTVACQLVPNFNTNNVFLFWISQLFWCLKQSSGNWCSIVINNTKL